MSAFSFGRARNCFVWAVERPLKGRNRYSPDFLIDEDSYYLTLQLKGKMYELHMECNEVGRLHSQYCLTVHVEDRDAKALPLSSGKKTVNINSTLIWKFAEKDIVGAMPNFLTDGLLIFLLTFAEKGFPFKYDIKLKPTENKEVIQKEDKSVQVEDANCIKKVEKSQQTSFSLPCLESLSGDLSKLLAHGSEPDMVLECADGVVGVHKNIVCARSKSLSKMLQNETHGKISQIKMEGMTYEVLNYFVHYMYTGQVPSLTVDSAKLLYQAGQKYDVIHLAKRCAHFLAEHFDPENVYEVIVLSDAYSDYDLQESSLNYILQNKIFLFEDIWMPFSQDYPNLANKIMYNCLKSQHK